MGRKQYKAKEPIKIRFKKLANGNKSIYLDYWNGDTQKRQYEFLNLHLIPDTLQDAKEKNERVLTVANKIKNDRLEDLVNGKAGIRGKKCSKVLVSDYLESKQQDKDKGNAVKMQYHSIQKLLNEFDKNLTMEAIDRGTIVKFTRFLRGSVGNRGELAPTTIQKYLSVFYGVLAMAYEERIITENPVKQFRKNERYKAKPIQRCYLEKDEVKKLIDTECRADIKQAFLFACFCGLRISDIKGLQWKHITKNENGVEISIIQKKTGDVLLLPLSQRAVEYLPIKPATATKDDFVFSLPTTPILSKIVKKWGINAGIDKYITFHTSRHTFATMLMTNGADLYTTSRLLGHKKIETTQIYAEITDKRKRQVVDLLDNF